MYYYQLIIILNPLLSDFCCDLKYFSNQLIIIYTSIKFANLYIYCIFSSWYRLYRRRFKIIIHLVNRKNFIQATCKIGRDTKTKCQMMAYQTDEIPILCSEKLRVLFAPVVKCKKHGLICKLYGWKSDEERLELGKGDEILNLFRWWICIPSDGKPGMQRKYFQSRYLFSDLLLGNMVDAIVKQKMSPTKWCESQLAKYAEYARQIWIMNGEDYENLHKEVMMDEITSFFHPDTIKGIITELG